MGSIRIRIEIAADGTITGRAPPGVAPGALEVEVPAEPPPIESAKAFMADWPVHDCGPWPEGLSLRREDLYGDNWR
ncbi:MAG: hypothetical protein ACKO1J_07545 [Tagaea sp.]